MMSFVRGLQCFAVLFLFGQLNGAKAQTCSDPETCARVASHLVDNAYTGVSGYVVKFMKNMIANSKSGDGTPFITDKEFEKIFDTVYAFLPEEARKGPGKDFGLQNIVSAGVDYFTDKWIGNEPDSFDKVKAKISAPVDTLLMASRFTSDWLKSFENPIFKFARQLLTDYFIPFMDMVKYFVDIAIDGVLSGKWTEGVIGRDALRSLGSRVSKAMREIGGEFIDGQSLKHSKLVGRGSSVQARRKYVLNQELEKENAGFMKNFLSTFAFGFQTSTNFMMVFAAVREECYNGKDKLEYEVIKGGSQVDEEYLKGVMETANNARPLACKYYRNWMGPKAEREYEFTYDEFMKVYNDQPASSDTLMIDAVAHNMLGDVEPACMFRFLCYAGLNRMKQEREGKRHPGVDLVLGITLSGRYNFAGLMNLNVMHKVGNTKMAEALYRGFNDDCAAYDALQDCYDHEEFLNPDTQA